MLTLLHNWKAHLSVSSRLLFVIFLGFIFGWKSAARFFIELWLIFCFTKHFDFIWLSNQPAFSVIIFISRHWNSFSTEHERKTQLIEDKKNHNFYWHIYQVFQIKWDREKNWSSWIRFEFPFISFFWGHLRNT